MKILLLFVLVGTMLSCTTFKKSSSVLKADDFPITRKYIGNFVDYCHTGPEVFGGVNLIWIKTTLYTSFGKISAYSKECDFSAGDKIYLRQMYPTPGPYGNWDYLIENDSSVVYRVSNYRYENNALVQVSF
jgi:hypothetical protein